MKLTKGELRYLEDISIPKGGFIRTIVHCNKRYSEDISIPKGVHNPERFHWRMKQAILNLVMFKNLTLKACVMPMGGTTSTFPVGFYTSIDKAIEYVQKIVVPTTKKYQKLGQIFGDDPDGCWGTIDENGHMMQTINFARYEHMDPESSGLGVALESIAKSSKLGYPLFGVTFPHYDKIKKMAPYHKKFELKTDPNETSDNFDLNMLFRLFPNKNYEIKKRAKR